MHSSPSGVLKPGVSEPGHVLDASALLALIFAEPGAARVASLLPDAAISAVNLAEVATRLADRGFSEADWRRLLALLDLDVRALSEQDALAVAALRQSTRPFGLSLGDRACLTLAGSLGAVAVTADRAWAALAGPDLAIDVIR